MRTLPDPETATQCGVQAAYYCELSAHAAPVVAVWSALFSEVGLNLQSTCTETVATGEQLDQGHPLRGTIMPGASRAMVWQSTYSNQATYNKNRHSRMDQLPTHIRDKPEG